MYFFAFSQLNMLTHSVELLAHWRDLISFANKLCKQTLCSLLTRLIIWKPFLAFVCCHQGVCSGQKVNLSFSLVLIAKFEILAVCYFSLNAMLGCTRGAVEASSIASESWGLICVLSSGSGSSGTLWTGTHLELLTCRHEDKMVSLCGVALHLRMCKACNSIATWCNILLQSS